MVASSIDDAPFSRVGGTVYNKQSHAIAFGAGDANFTKFGLLPMSFQTQRPILGATKYENAPFRQLVDIPYRKLLENLNKARPGGKCGPEGPLGLDVDPPNPNES